MDKTSRNLGSYDVKLGGCVNADNGKIGPNVLKHITVTQEERNHVSIKYKQVKNPRESRDFLGVSNGTVLKVKAGFLPPDELTEYLFQTAGTNEKTTAEILVRLECVKVVESVETPGANNVNNLTLEELTPFTHFVQSVTFGGELVACVKVTNCIGSLGESTESLADSEGDVVNLSYDKLYGDINRLKAGNSVVTIQCYATGCDIERPTESVSQLLSLLHDFASKVNDKGAPLKCGLQALSSLPGFEDKLPVCTEKKPIFASPQLQEFENQFSDVCKTEDILRQTLQDSEDRVKDRHTFNREVETFRTTLQTIKKVYTDFIGSDMDRCSSEIELNGLLNAVQQKYDEMKPREKTDNFTTAIAAALTPKFEAEKYRMLTKEEWTRMIDRGAPESFAKAEDEDRKENVDKFLKRVTLERNTLDHLKETGEKPVRPPELRVVLLGKTGAGKSATGNTLLGEKVFNENDDHLSGVVKTEARKFQIRGRTISIIDTPGVFDNVNDKEEVQLVIAQTLLTFSHGVHAFIYVLNGGYDRFTVEDKEALKQIKEIFGDALMKHTIVVYTKGEVKFNKEDATKKDLTLRDVLDKLKRELKPKQGDHKPKPEDPLAVLLTQDVDERVMAVNNSCASRYEKEKTREALIELIDVVQTRNKGKPYTDKYFEKGEQKLIQRDKEEEEAREKFLDDELKQWRNALRRAEEKSGCFLNKYWNTIQLDVLETERQMDFKNIIKAIVRNFEVLVKGFLEVNDKDLFGAVWDGMNDAAGCRLNRLEAEVDKQEDEMEGGCLPTGQDEIPEKRALIKEIKEKLMSSEKEIAEKRMELVELLSKKETRRQEYALVFEYAIQVSSLIAENYLMKMQPKELLDELQKNYTDIRKNVTKELKKYLKMMKEQLEVMLNYNKQVAGPAYNPIQMIVQEAVYTVAPAVMTRLLDEDNRGSYKNLRSEWRKRYIEILKEERTLTDELKKMYGRQWALRKAEENAEIQRDVKLIEASNKDHYIQQIKEDLKDVLRTAKHGKETWDFLSEREMVSKLAEKAVTESVTAAVEINARNRRKYRYLESSKVLDDSRNIKPMEVAETCTRQAAEFLAEMRLNYKRLQKIQGKHESETRNGGLNTDRKITEVLNDLGEEGSFDIFQRFVVPDGSLSVQEKIAAQFAKLHIKNLMCELEDDLEKKESLKKEIEDLKWQGEKTKRDYETKIIDLTTFITSRIRDEAREYARNTTKGQLARMKKNNFVEASAELVEKVKEVLADEDEAKKYCEGQKIDEAIRKYTKLNYKILAELAKCFPSDVTVVEEKKGKIKISDVRVGDKILTVSAEGTTIYEEVFMFAHADPTAIDTYLEVHTEAGPSVPMSRNHLLHVGCQGKLKATKDVANKDTVLVMSDGRLQKTKITEIVEVTKRGAYCPYTTGGSLVVNNILASCYTDVISHQVAHVMLFPVRLLYFLLPSRVFSWLFWYDEKVGMPKLLLQVKNFYQWMWGNQRV